MLTCRKHRPTPTALFALRRGFLATDAIVAVILVMAAGALFVVGLRAYANARDDGYVRQRILATAETELQRIATGVAALPSDGTSSERDESDIHLRIRGIAGDGPWSGLTLVTVQCETTSKRGGVIRGELSQYFAPIATKAAAAGGAP